jgi:apolipoprotein D and lipocalin family protein
MVVAQSNKRQKKMDVDLDKYIGKWYEVDSFPAWFQKGCKNTTAEYTKKEDYVEVINSCDIENKTDIYRKSRKGKAYTTDDPNLLKVSFFSPFKGDYKIEHIETKDGEYQYSIVGSGGRQKKYLWILSRKPNNKVSDEDYNKMVDIAREKGYDVSRLKQIQKRKRKEKKMVKQQRKQQKKHYKQQKHRKSKK